MKNIHETLFGKVLSILLCWSILLTSLPLYAGNTVKPAAESEQRLSNYSPQPQQTVTTNFEYDGNNNIVARIDGNGERTEYEYDRVNRLKSIDYPGGDGPEVCFTYDGNGNLTSMTDWMGTTRYTYDDLNRLQRVDNPDGNSIIYWYDFNGNITRVACGRQSMEGYTFTPVRITDEDLYAYHVVEYTYDPDNRISSVTDYMSKETTSYTYDKAGNLTRCDLPNDCYVIYGYDSNGRLVEVENQNTRNGLISKYEYTLNSIGNRIKVVETTPTDSKTTTYTYDVLDRLDTISYPDGRTVDYDYDSFGNRTKMKEFRGNTMTVTEYFYDSDSRLLYTKVNGIEDDQFSYDAIGNLIRRTGPGENKQVDYTYDHENRLIHYNDGTNDVTYTYDGLGNRIAKNVNGRHTSFLNDASRRPNRAIAETDTFGLPKRVHTWGNSRLGMRDKVDSRNHYFLHDTFNGSVSGILDSAGEVVNSYDYDAFGSPTRKIEAMTNDYQFLGGAQEEETGLVFFGMRYADPILGRFITPLPHSGDLMLRFGLNQYVSLPGCMGGLRDPAATTSNVYDVAKSVAQSVATDLLSKKWAKLTAKWIFYVLGIVQRAGIAWNTFRDLRTKKASALDLTHDVAMLIASAFWKYGIVFIIWDWATYELAFAYFTDPAFKYACDRAALSGLTGFSASYFRPNASDDDHKGSGDEPPGGGGGGGGGSGGGGGLGGGGVVSQSRLGGVDLNQTAEVFAEIDDIKGVAYDPATGQLVIYGQENTSLPPMNFDDFVVAARAILRGFDPVVSIDPPEVTCIDEQGNERLCHSVRYGPYLSDNTVPEDLSSGTHFGWVMFEADRLVKCLALGKDNITREDIICSVPSYKSLVQRLGEAREEGKISARFWFQPETIKVVPSPDGKSMMFAEASMELLTEAKYTSDGEYTGGPQAEAFAAHFNEHFDEFAREFRVFEDLRQLAKIVGIIKWIVENDIPIDLSIINNYTLTSWDTPSVTPITTVTETGPTEDGGEYILTLTGGVTYEKDIQIAPPTIGSESIVLAGRPNETDISWTVEKTETEYKAVAVSLEGQPMDGSFTWSDTDLVAKVNGTVPLALTRHYDSFNIEHDPFGWGWSAMPYQLQFKGAKSGFYFETSEQEGYNRISFIDRNTQSVFDYEPASFYDRQADPDRIAHEFDTQEDILVYYHDFKKLPGVLFSDGPDRFIMRMANGMLLNFNANGMLVNIKDRNGNQIVYGYDQSGKLVSISQPSSGRTISLSYDGNGRIISATGPGGKTMNYTYDAAGNLVQVAQYIPEAQASVSRAAIALMEVYQDTPESESTEYRYDDQHHLIEVIDSDGQMLFTLEYDVYGRVVCQTGPDGTTVFSTAFSLAEGKTQTIGPEDFSQLREYDDNYDLIRWTDARGNVTNFAYNSHQNLTSIVDADGYTTKFYYRQDGYPVAVAWPNGNSDFVSLNEFGYPKEFWQISPDTDFEDNFDEDHLWVGGAYNFLNNLSNLTKYEWDDVGNLKKITDAQSNEYSFEYDSYGNLNRFVDARGFGTSYTYDGLSRLTEVSNEMGHAVSFGYDKRDNLTVVTTEAGSVELTYDAQDRLHSIIYGDTDARTSYVYEYNADSQLKNVTSPDGTVTSYVYDGSSNLAQVIHDEVMRFEYEYDDLNRIIQIRYSGTVSSELN